MDKTINIEGREIKFRATARTPRLYRMITNRDMIKDMNNLMQAFQKTTANNENALSQLTTEHLMIFEDSAYVMARHANPDMPEKSADDWLDTFEMFDIYSIFPELIELWIQNTATTAIPKKK